MPHLRAQGLVKLNASSLTQISSLLNFQHHHNHNNIGIFFPNTVQLSHDAYCWAVTTGQLMILR